MAGAPIALRADHGEAHRVLPAIADPLGGPRIAPRAEEAGMRGDDQRVVGGIDAEAVDVLDGGFGTRRYLG